MSPHSQKEHIEVSSILKLNVYRAYIERDTLYRHSNTPKFTKKYIDVQRVCPAIHTFLINFQVYKQLYLVQYWPDQHQTSDCS